MYRSGQYKTRTRYKTRTTHYGLGMKYGLGYKTWTEHYGLSINMKKGSTLKATCNYMSLLSCVKPGSHMPPTYLGPRCGIHEHLSPTRNLSQALIAGLPAKLSRVQLRRQAGGQCLGQIMCRRSMFTYAAVVPGRPR